MVRGIICKVTVQIGEPRLNATTVHVLNRSYAESYLLYTTAYHSSPLKNNHCIARSKTDGTRRRMGGDVKGKDANGLGSQQPCTVCWKSVTTNSKNMRQAG